MKKYWVYMGITLGLFIMTACSKSSDYTYKSGQVDGEGTVKMMTMSLSESQEEITEANLSSDIQALMDDTSLTLKIGTDQEPFLEVSQTFKNRLLKALIHSSKTYKDHYSMIEPDLILKAKGYKTIYINLDNQNYWFEGEDVSYEVEGLGDLWSRYVIKKNQGEFVYDHFEKNVMTRFKVDLDHDDVEDLVMLYDDSSIGLSVNDSKLQLNSNGLESSFGGDIDSSEKMGLDYLKDFDLIVFTYEGMSIHGEFKTFRFFKYEDHEIHEVSYDLNCQLKTIDLDQGTYEIQFLPSQLTYKVHMDEEAIETSRARKAEIEVDMDSEALQKYENDLVTALLIESEEALIQDKEDGQTELLVSGRLQMKFGSSYLYIDEPIQLTYQIESNHIDLKQVVLKERE